MSRTWLFGYGSLVSLVTRAGQRFDSRTGLVENAFTALGGDHADWYAQTPAPDIRVADIALHPLD